MIVIICVEYTEGWSDSLLLRARKSLARISGPSVDCRLLSEASTVMLHFLLE